MLNTSLCYIRRGGEVLLMHRIKKAQDQNRDKWIGIGGKFEPGESPEDCMLREVYEETGLSLDAWRYRGIITFVLDGETEYMHLFTADRFHGRLREDCAEGQLEWLPWETLPTLPIWEGDKIFLRLLDEEVPFFSLKLCYHADSLIQAVLNGEKILP